MESTPREARFAQGTYSNADGSTGTQTGYVAVYNDGVVACNGADQTANGSPDTAQGYIWVGSGHAASNPTAEDPTGNLGAGNNQDPATGTGAYCSENNTGNG